MIFIAHINDIYLRTLVYKKVKYLFDFSLFGILDFFARFCPEIVMLLTLCNFHSIKNFNQLNSLLKSIEIQKELVNDV